MMAQGRARLLLALLFLVLALPLGLFLALRVPLGQVADEPGHVLKAESLLHGEWIGRRQMRPGPAGTTVPREGLDADRALLSVIVSPLRVLDSTPTAIDPAALERSRSVRFGDVGFGETGTIASYFPAFYLPAAGALAVAKALGLGARDGFLGARLANLLVTLAMGAAALLLARRGGAMLFAVLLLPPSLGLMGSVNQDGLLIASAVLAASLASRIDAALPPWRQPCFRGAFLLVALVCLAKPPYLPMTALLLLPAGRRWTRPLPAWFAARSAGIIVILLLVLAWTWANVHFAAAPVYRAPEEAGPLWPGHRPAVFAGTDMAAQLQVLLAKPWRMLWLPWHSMLIHPGIFRQMVDVMGWLNLMLPPWLAGLWALSLCSALFGGVATGTAPGTVPSTTQGAGWPQSVLLVFAVAATIVLIYLSQYLSFTPVGWNWISGPQGRYLIPLLPMLALAMPSVARRPVAAWLPVVPAGLAALLGLWAVPACVRAFYYAGSP